jgi:hypothetical protein
LVLSVCARRYSDFGNEAAAHAFQRLDLLRPGVSVASALKVRDGFCHGLNDDQRAVYYGVHEPFCHLASPANPTDQSVNERRAELKGLDPVHGDREVAPGNARRPAPPGSNYGAAIDQLNACSHCGAAIRIKR